METEERLLRIYRTDVALSLVHALNQTLSNQMGAQELLYRKTALRFDNIFANTTCVKNNIHFPVDRVLPASFRAIIKTFSLRTADIICCNADPTITSFKLHNAFIANQLG
jgi:hypothetical protein